MRGVARSGGTSAGRQMAVILGRAAGVPPVRRGALRWTDSVSADFQFKAKETLPNFRPPWRNKGVEAEKYAEVHFSELMRI